MKIYPIEYANLVQFDLKVTTIDQTGTSPKIYFISNTPPDTNIFRNYDGKEIHFIFGGVTYIGKIGHDKTSNINTFITNITNVATLLQTLIVNSIFQVYDTFSISKENQVVTIQDIIEKLPYKGTTDVSNDKFELNNGIVYEYISGKNKPELLYNIDKHRLNNVPLILKSNDITINKLTFIEIGKLKVSSINEVLRFQLFIREETTNNILDAEFIVIPDAELTDLIQVKVNHCSFEETEGIEFKFTNITYTPNTENNRITVEIKLSSASLSTNKIYKVFWGITSIDSLQTPVATVNTNTPIVFNTIGNTPNGDSILTINKYLLSADYLNKRALLTDAEKAAIGSAGSTKFTSNIAVNLSNNKTLGRYVSGDVIQSANKTFEEVMNMISQEPIPPALILSSTTNILFNQTAISNVLNFSKTIKSLGATIATAVLEWRRNNTGAWIQLTNDVNLSTYTHNLTDSTFSVLPFNYRYTVTDSIGASAIVYCDITPQAYVAPTIALNTDAVTLGPIDTNIKREFGNTNTRLSGGITRNSVNVSIINYQYAVSVDGGNTFVNIGSLYSANAAGGSMNIYVDNTPVSANLSAIYKVTVTDTYTTTIITKRIDFANIVFYGDSSLSPLTSLLVRNLPNKLFADAVPSNQIILNTGTANKIFAIAVPATKSITSIIDLDALNAVITDNYVLNAMMVDNYANVATSYKVYIMTNAVPYPANHRHQIQIA